VCSSDLWIGIVWWTVEFLALRDDWLVEVNPQLACAIEPTPEFPAIHPFWWRHDRSCGH